MWLLVPLAASLPPPPLAPSPSPPTPFTVKFLATHLVQGAAFPTDSFFTECSSAQNDNTEECRCHSGAARRQALFAAAGDEVVRIDTGGFYSGSGLFFPAFRGNASARFFAVAGYHAYSLSYRDLSAGVSSGDLTGGVWLRGLLELARTLDPALPPAVVTNLDLQDDPYLTEAHVTRYTVVPLPNGRRMGVLALLPPRSVLSKHYAARLLPLDRGLAIGLADLQRLPGGPPDVTVCIISGLPDGAFGADARTREFLADLAEPAIGLDAFVVVDSDKYDSGELTVSTWYGEQVAVFFLANDFGSGIANLQMSVGEAGATDASAELPWLECSKESDPYAQSLLNEYKAQLDSRFSEIVGVSGTPLDDPRKVGPGDCVQLLRSEGRWCGCRVSACVQGMLVADALRWYADAEVGLINGGALRRGIPGPEGAAARASAGERTDFDVSRGDILQLLPYLNEVHRLEMTGATLREVLKHSIGGLDEDDVAVDPAGRFLQVSETLRFRWYYEGSVATLGLVELKPPGAPDSAFAPLNLSRTYTVGSIAYLSAGGDGYAMLPPTRAAQLGVTTADAVAAYLTATAPTAPGLVPGLGGGARIQQTELRLLLPLGVLCYLGTEERPVHSLHEECDHAEFTIRALNDKTDGLWDDLLPFVTIDPIFEHEGCTGTPVPSQMAYQRLLTHSPNLTAIVGGGCTDSLAAMSAADFRQTLGARPSVFISPSATGSAIADEIRYPNVARVISSESWVGGVFAAVASFYSWRRVAVLRDSSSWAQDASSQFARAHAALGGDVLLPGVSVNVSLCSAHSSGSWEEEVLHALERVDARVVYLPVQPPCARLLLSASYRTKLLHGEGYAWLLPQATAEVFSTGGTIDADAVAGAQGLLNVRELFDEDEPMYSIYRDTFRAAATLEGCDDDHSSHSHNDTDLCLSSSSPLSDLDFPQFALHNTDAVLLYAHAMDSLYNTHKGLPDLAHRLSDPDALYAQMKALGGFSGVGGRVRLDKSADKEGTFEVVNLRVDAGVPFYSVVGFVDTHAGASQISAADVLIEARAVVFPGPTSTWPIDAGSPMAPPPRWPHPSPPPPRMPPPPLPPPPPPWFDEPWFIATMSVLGAAVVVLLLLLLARRLRKARRMQKKLEQEEEEQVLSAIRYVRELQFPAVLVTADFFLEQGALLPHEEVRNRAGTEYIDLMEKLVFSEAIHIVFFSHQWTSWDHPDHTGRQYKVMASALRTVIGAQHWQQHQVRVWVDYQSIPQKCKSVQQLAINSLAAYSSSAHAFVIVAPDVLHKDTLEACNAHSYQRRMWCRAEQFCHLLVNGTSSMWQAVEEGKCVLVAKLNSRDSTATTDTAGLHLSLSGQWAFDALRVFEGEVTCEDDKFKLMLPVLGLYAYMLAASLDNASAVAAELKAAIASCKEDIFPAELTAPSPSRRRRGLSRSTTGSVTRALGSFSSKPSGTSRTRPRWPRCGGNKEAKKRELFGDLIARMEHIIETNEGVRAPLSAWARRRTLATTPRLTDRSGSACSINVPVQPKKKRSVRGVLAATAFRRRTNSGRAEAQPQSADALRRAIEVREGTPVRESVSYVI